jgi:hypothetical protein
MNDPMLPLSGLSPVAGKKVVVNFDGGLLSSTAGFARMRAAGAAGLDLKAHPHMLRIPSPFSARGPPATRAFVVRPGRGVWQRGSRELLNQNFYSYGAESGYEHGQKYQ